MTTYLNSEAHEAAKDALRGIQLILRESFDARVAKAVRREFPGTGRVAVELTADGVLVELDWIPTQVSPGLRQLLGDAVDYTAQATNTWALDLGDYAEDYPA